MFTLKQNCGCLITTFEMGEKDIQKVTGYRCHAKKKSIPERVVLKFCETQNYPECDWFKNRT